MKEQIFTSILTVSTNIAKKSKVKVLREVSKEIIKSLGVAKTGVFIISGVRGSGKTTLLSELFKMEKNVLFLNAEIALKYGISLLDLLHYAYSRGYKSFLIDEIHALADWEKDIKIFFDETKCKIIISGSSAILLKAKGSELSRRASFYDLKPLSFREYLLFKTGKLLPKISLEELISPQRRKELEQMLIPYIDYYSAYIQFEALPAAFFEQNKSVYLNILERTIRYDLLHLREVDAAYVENVFRAIKIIATSIPGELSYSGLSNSLGIGIKLVRDIVNSLSATGILYIVPPQGTGKKAVRKEEKILMPLAFRSALCEYYGIKPDSGGLREDFFVQHVGNCFYLKTGVERRTPDFVVGNYVFEIGGKSKGHKQIKGFKNSFIVKEAILLGEKEIPIYLFGLLY